METMTYIDNSATMELPRVRRTRSVKREVPADQPIPEGYMSLEQFEKELVEAVVKKL